MNRRRRNIVLKTFRFGSTKRCAPKIAIAFRTGSVFRRRRLRGRAVPFGFRFVARLYGIFFTSRDRSEQKCFDKSCAAVVGLWRLGEDNCARRYFRRLFFWRSRRIFSISFDVHHISTLYSQQQVLNKRMREKCKHVWCNIFWWASSWLKTRYISPVILHVSVKTKSVLKASKLS